ncbi:MAG TPA: Crp/Fnr family transcriptional regulator [Pyrinomonadaceae bacterium]|jgi:CRP-like cAMP-binding protein
MRNEFENKNDVMRRVVSVGSRGADVNSRARLLTKEMLKVKPAPPQSIKSFPFNGLLTNKLLTALPDTDFARLLPHLEPVSLAGGENLYALDESIQFVYFPETVVLSHIHLLADGSTVEAALIGREGMVGLSTIFNSSRPRYWTQVTIAGSALRIQAEVVRQDFAAGRAIQQLLLNYASERLAHLSQRAVCNGRHTVDARLCSWLLMVQDRAGDHLLPLTQEQIASYLGTRRAGVTCAAASLRDRKIISYSRGHIRILKRQALENAACECYRMQRQT